MELYTLSDVSDLSVYGLGSANNGGGSPGAEFTFPSGTADAGDFIYVASETQGFTDFFGFAPDYTSSAANINGDDALELFQAGEVVDTFGEVDVDGTGQPWEYLDGWAYRQANTNEDAGFVFDDWTFQRPERLRRRNDERFGEHALPYRQLSARRYRRRYGWWIQVAAIRAERSVSAVTTQP